MKHLLVSAALIFTLSACATALESATQEVTVLTPGTYDSFCYLDNGELVYRTLPPQTIRVSKRPGDLTVRCVADGNREQTLVIESKAQELALANAFNGFLPGMLVDYHSGALFAYPNVITVDFTDIPPRQMLPPNYDLHLQDNPELFGMEEFRPGDAALIRDKYEESIELKKREFPAAPVITGMTESSAGSSSGSSDTAAGDTASSGQSQTDMVSELTRKMNPQVFGAQAADKSASRPAGEGPVTIYPVE